MILLRVAAGLTPGGGMSSSMLRKAWVTRFMVLSRVAAYRSRAVRV